MTSGAQGERGPYKASHLREELVKEVEGETTCDLGSVWTLWASFLSPQGLNGFLMGYENAPE